MKGREELFSFKIPAPSGPGAKIGRPRPSTTATPRKLPLHSHSAFKPFAHYSDRLLVGSHAQVAVFCGPYERRALGKHSLQALQSTLVRNGIRPSGLNVYFDRDIFASPKAAVRIHRLFHFLSSAHIHPREDSRLRLGVQAADAVAHSFAQILKQELTGTTKLVDISGPNS